MKFRELSKKWKAVVILLSALLVVLMLFVSTERSKWSKARKRITRQSVIPVAWRWGVSAVGVCSQRWQPAYHTGRIRGFSGSLLREKPLESESSYWSAPGCQQAYNGVSGVPADITGSLPDHDNALCRLFQRTLVVTLTIHLKDVPNAVASWSA